MPLTPLSLSLSLPPCLTFLSLCLYVFLPPLSLYLSVFLWVYLYLSPSFLVGTIQTYLDPVNISTVESKYPEVRKGGNFRPKECTARERLAVIIPCRNRTQHLHILLNNLLRLLIKQRLDFTIFVIDQVCRDEFMGRS